MSLTDGLSNHSDPGIDPLWERYRDLDFSDARPVAEVPTLVRLHAEQGQLTTVILPVDRKVLAAFEARAEKTGMACEQLMQEAWREFVEGRTLADVVRETIREELHSR